MAPRDADRFNQVTMWHQICGTGGAHSPYPNVNESMCQSSVPGLHADARSTVQTRARSSAHDQLYAYNYSYSTPVLVQYQLSRSSCDLPQNYRYMYGKTT